MGLVLFLYIKGYLEIWKKQVFFLNDKRRIFHLCSDGCKTKLNAVCLEPENNLDKFLNYENDQMCFWQPLEVVNSTQAQNISNPIYTYLGIYT